MGKERVIPRMDTAGRYAATNPQLAKGEIIFTADDQNRPARMKLGYGVNGAANEPTFNELPYALGDYPRALQTGVLTAPWEPGDYGNGLVVVEHEDHLFTLAAAIPRPYASTDFAAELANGIWISQGPKAGLGDAELLFQVGDLVNPEDSYVHLLRITIDQVNELLATTTYDRQYGRGAQYRSLTVATDVHGGHYHNVTLQYRTEDVTWFVTRVSTVPEGVVEGAEQGQESISDVTSTCTVRPVGEPQNYIFQLFNSEGRPVRTGYNYYDPIVTFSFGPMLAWRALYGGEVLLRSQFGISIRGGGSQQRLLQATLYYDATRATYKLKDLLTVDNNNQTAEYQDGYSLQLANSGDYGFRGMIQYGKRYLPGEMLVAGGNLVKYGAEGNAPDVVIHGRTPATGAIILLLDTTNPDGSSEVVTAMLDPDEQLKLASFPDEEVYALSESLYHNTNSGEREYIKVPVTRDAATNTLRFPAQFFISPAQIFNVHSVTVSLAGLYTTKLPGLAFRATFLNQYQQPVLMYGRLAEEKVKGLIYDGTAVRVSFADAYEPYAGGNQVDMDLTYSLATNSFTGVSTYEPFTVVDVALVGTGIDESVYVKYVEGGIVLTSPSGNRFRVNVSDTGELSTLAL